MTLALAGRIERRVQEALSGSPLVERQFTIAGEGIDVTIEPSAADAFLAPFEHLEVRESRPVSLRIRAAAMEARVLSRLEVSSDNASVDSAGELIVHVHPRSVAVLDRRKGEIHALVPVAAEVPSWMRAKPLQLLLSVFFADRGVGFLHGGMVARGGRALLIAGNGGTGKSTLAIASVLAGLDYLADDCVGVQGTDGYSIYGSGCVTPEQLQRFGLTPTGETDEKSVLRIGRMFPERMGQVAEIRGIVLPRVTGAATVSIHRASGRDALLSLAPGSILKRAVPASGTMARMARLASSVPVFRLEMGPVAEAGRAMVELIEEVS